MSCPPQLRPVFDVGHSTTDLALALCYEAQSVFSTTWVLFVCRGPLAGWTDPCLACLPFPLPSLLAVAVGLCVVWLPLVVVFVVVVWHVPTSHCPPSRIASFVHTYTGTQTRERGRAQGRLGMARMGGGGGQEDTKARAASPCVGPAHKYLEQERAGNSSSISSDSGSSSSSTKCMIGR